MQIMSNFCACTLQSLTFKTPLIPHGRGPSVALPASFRRTQVPEGQLRSPSQIGPLDFIVIRGLDASPCVDVRLLDVRTNNPREIMC